MSAHDDERLRTLWRAADELGGGLAKELASRAAAADSVTAKPTVTVPRVPDSKRGRSWLAWIPVLLFLGWLGFVTYDGRAKKDSRADKPPAVQQQAPARLSVTGSPSPAYISIQGPGDWSRVGKSPLTVETDVPGRYRVHVSQAGYNSWWKSVTIDANSKGRELEYKLTPIGIR